MAFAKLLCLFVLITQGMAAFPNLYKDQPDETFLEIVTRSFREMTPLFTMIAVGAVFEYFHKMKIRDRYRKINEM